MNAATSNFKYWSISSLQRQYTPTGFVMHGTSLDLCKLDHLRFETPLQYCFTQEVHHCNLCTRFYVNEMFLVS